MKEKHIDYVLRPWGDVHCDQELPMLDARGTKRRDMRVYFPL